MATPAASIQPKYYPIFMHSNTPLGHFVSEKEYLIKEILFKRMEICEEENKLRHEKQHMLSNPSYLKQSDELQQRLQDIFNEEILKLQDEESKLSERIEELNLSDSNISDCLPFNFNSKPKIKEGVRGIQSEVYFFEEFTLYDQISKKFLDCMKNLFVGYPELSIPKNELDSNISTLLNKTEYRVFLFGASIILDRKLTLDPTEIDQSTIKNSELCKNSSKIFVLSEAILEGFFISVAISNHPSGLSSFFAGKPITSGSCPIFTPQGSNLLEKYESWKDHMVSEPESGFSVKYMARRLDHILNENNLEHITE